MEIAKFCVSENYIVISKKLSHRDADRILRMEKWQNAQKMVAPLLDLENLKISSACSERTLTFLLYQCLNVKEIYMGMTTCVSDQVFSDVLTKNSLSRLERLKIQKCSKVSNFTFSQTCALCVNCGNYRPGQANCKFQLSMLITKNPQYLTDFDQTFRD